MPSLSLFAFVWLLLGLFIYVQAAQIINIAVRTLNTPTQCSSPLAAVDPDLPLGLVFASCEDGIIVINGTQVQTIVPSAVPGCVNPQGLAIHSGLLYATCLVVGTPTGVATVVRVNLTDPNWAFTTLATDEQCLSPQQLDIDRSTGIVYVTCFSSVLAINGTELSTFVPYNVCHYPTVVSTAARSAHHANGVIYVACATDPDPPVQPSFILAVDPMTGNISRIAADIDAQCQNPMAIAIDLKSDTLYVSCFGDSQTGNYGAIVSVQGAKTSTLVSGEACHQPTTVAFDHITGLIFFNCGIFQTVALERSNFNLTTLAGAECENPKSLQPIFQTSNHPIAAQRGSSIAPTTFSLLVSCQNTDTVELITGLAIP